MEILDIVDAEGNPTGKTVERTVAHRDGIPHRTSHVWLLRRRNGAVEVLLQKRSLQKDSFPGCWDISSAGHIPAGSGYRDSAVRELREELGLTVQEDELISCGRRTIRTDRVFGGVPFHDRQVSEIFAVWRDVEPSEMVLQQSEVDDVQWLAFESCLRAVRENAFPHCIVPEELEMLRAAF